MFFFSYLISTHARTHSFCNMWPPSATTQKLNRFSTKLEVCRKIFNFLSSILGGFNFPESEVAFSIQTQRMHLPPGISSSTRELWWFQQQWQPSLRLHSGSSGSVQQQWLHGPKTMLELVVAMQPKSHTTAARSAAWESDQAHQGQKCMLKSCARHWPLLYNFVSDRKVSES